jgi:Na+-transporting methylmalonyl-CoA/oxaloacetate decarboxylase gamma subunit
MSELIDSLKTMDTSTLFILGFAAVLLIFLLVLIIVTIKVLASSGKYEEEKKPRRTLPEDDDDDEYDDDDSDDGDDEMSRRVREAVESVEETKAKVEAEKIAREMVSAAEAED